MNAASPCGLSRWQTDRRVRSARFTSARVAVRSGARKECLPVRAWRRWKPTAIKVKVGSLVRPKRGSKELSNGHRMKRETCSSECGAHLLILLIGISGTRTYQRAKFV